MKWECTVKWTLLIVLLLATRIHTYCVPDIKTDSFTTSILLHQFTVPSELPADSCEEYTDSFHLTDLLVHYSDVGEAGIVESSDSVSDIPIDGTCTGALSTSYHVDVDGESDTLQVFELNFTLSNSESTFYFAVTLSQEDTGGDSTHRRRYQSMASSNGTTNATVDMSLIVQNTILPSVRFIIWVPVLIILLCLLLIQSLVIIKCFFMKRKRISKFHLDTGSYDAMYKNKAFVTPSSEDLKKEDAMADKKGDFVESGISVVEADPSSSSTKAKRQKRDRKSLPLLDGPEAAVSSKIPAREICRLKGKGKPQTKMEMERFQTSSPEVKKLVVESGTQLNEHAKKPKKRERKTVPAELEEQGQGKQMGRKAKSASNVKTSEKESTNVKTSSAKSSKKPPIALKPHHLAGRKRPSSSSSLGDIAEEPAVTQSPCSECESDSSILEKVSHHLPTNLEDIPATSCSECETDSSFLESIVHHLPTNLDQVSADTQTSCSDCQSDASLLEDIVHNFPTGLLRRFSVVTHPQNQTQTLEVLDENSAGGTMEKEEKEVEEEEEEEEVDQKVPQRKDEDSDGYISASHGKPAAVFPPGDVLPSNDTCAADIQLQDNEAYNQIRHAEGSQYNAELILQHNEAYSINPESSANPNSDDVTNEERIYENTINCTWIPSAETQDNYDYVKS